MKKRLNWLLRNIFRSALSLLIPAALYAQTIRIDGSSTVYPISKKAVNDFQNLMQGSIKASVTISGTGGGFRKFCRDEMDINNASRPILKQEMEVCQRNNVQYLELPLAYDALTVLVNPLNNWVKYFSVGE